MKQKAIVFCMALAVTLSALPVIQSEAAIVNPTDSESGNYVELVSEKETNWANINSIKIELEKTDIKNDDEDEMIIGAVGLMGSDLEYEQYVFHLYDDERIDNTYDAPITDCRIDGNSVTLTLEKDTPFFESAAKAAEPWGEVLVTSLYGYNFSVKDITYGFAEAPEQTFVNVSAYEIKRDNVTILKKITAMNPEDTYTNAMTNTNTSAYYSSSSDELPEDTIWYSGWFASPEGGKIIYSDTKLLSSEDHAIYYQTRQIPVHYVTFDAGEGSVVWYSSKASYNGNTHALAENEVIAPDQGRIQSAMPNAEWGTRRFLGWFTAPEGGEPVDYRTAFSGDTNQTVYAHWNEDDPISERTDIRVRKYSLSNDGEELVFHGDVTVPAGSAYKALFSNSNYSSASYTAKTANYVNPYELGTAVAYDWYTDKTGGMIIDRYSEELIPGDTTIYYRKGIFACHYLSFDAGDGEIFWNVSNPYYNEGNVPDAGELQLTVMEQHRVGTLPGAENGTHAFLGWFTAPTGGTQITAETFYQETGDMTLYAHWDDADTSEAPAGQKLRIYSKNESTGEYSIQHDYRGTDTTTYYNLMYGNSSSSTAVKYAASSSKTEIPDGTAIAYRYFDAPEGGNEILLSDPVEKTGDIALYYRAVFVPYHYVRFDPNGGELLWTNYRYNSGYSNGRALKDDEIVVLENSSYGRFPNADNGTRKFLGWFTAPEGGEQLNEYAIFRGTADTTLYAHWDEEGTADARTKIKASFYRKSSYFEDYELYADVLAEPETYAELIGSLRFGIASSYSSETIPEGQVRLSGWFTAPTGGERINNSTKMIPESNFALYYGSELGTYHYVTFNPNGGVLSEYVVTEPVVTEPGQSTYMTTTTVAYATSSSTKTTVKPPASDQIMVTEGNSYGTLLKAYMEGHEFKGWFTSKVGGQQVTSDMIFNGTSDQTLYARFEGVETQIDFTLGDINNDGLVDVSDAQRALLAYVDGTVSGNNGLNDTESLAADIDGNGEVDISDAQLILLYYSYNTLTQIPTTWDDLLHNEK